MASRTKPETTGRAPLDSRRVGRALAILRREAPGWNAPIVGFIAMQSRDPFKTLISCILSLRTKDQTTAIASERLFARADTAAKMLALSTKTLERLIYPVGFYRTKARVIRGICRDLIDKFHGRVPDEIDELLTLKGVGRKTANLVVTEALREAGNLRRYSRPSHFESMGPGENQNARQDRDCAARSSAAASLDRVQRNSGRVRPDDLSSDFAVVLAMQNRRAMPANRSRALALTHRFLK